MQKSLAFFSHIPKAAGSTLLEILHAQYRRRELLELYDVYGEKRNAILAALAPDVRMIAGHHNFSVRQRVPRPCHTITVLRDPVELVISLYFYIRRCPTHPLYETIVSGQMDLRGLAAMERRRQATWIAGERKATPLPDDELLALARANLLAPDVTFGIAEAFDESVVFFGRALGWRLKPYSAQNVTRDRPKRDQLDAADLAAIEEQSAADIELYRAAREAFERRVREQPASFADDVARVRQRSLLGSAVATVKRRLRRLRAKG